MNRMLEITMRQEVRTESADGGETVVIRVAGRFDSAQREVFRSAVSEAVRGESVSELMIDLGPTGYIDSHALGELLSARESAAAAHKSVTLANAKGDVKRALDFACFDKIFQFRESAA